MTQYSYLARISLTASTKFCTFTEKETISFWYSCETGWSFLISCTSLVNSQSESPKRSCNVAIILSGVEALMSKAETAIFAGLRKHFRSLHKFSLSVNLHTSVDSSYACLNWSHSRGSSCKSGKSLGVHMRLNMLASGLCWAAELARLFTTDASIWIVPSAMLAAGAFVQVARVCSIIGGSLWLLQVLHASVQPLLDAASRTGYTFM